MAELKPCPFCGGEAKRYQLKHPSGIVQYAVACMNDDCLVSPTTAAYKTKGADAKAWNRRAGDGK